MSGPFQDASLTSSSPLWREESWERSKYSTLPQPPLLGIVTVHKESVWTIVKKKIGRGYSVIKNACIARYIICSAINCDCRSIYHNYFFWSKATALILLLNALYCTALCGITAPMLEVIFGSQYYIAQVVLLYGTSQILFPIAGHIADAYIGRHSVLRFSLWCAWIAFALAGVMVSLDSYDNHINSVNRYIIFPLVSLMLSVSYMCFMANIIPFGLDQLQGAPHVHYSSFLYWWYWTVKIGAITEVFPFNCFNLIEFNILMKIGIGLLGMTGCLLLDAMFKTCLVLEPCCNKQENPLGQIARVVGYIINMPPHQYVPSSVRHEIDFTNYSRLDLAKKRYGGKYETEQVENVRTFFSILLILISVGTIIFSSAMMSGVLNLLKARQLEYQLSIYGDQCNTDLSSLSILYVSLTLFLLPLLDLVIVPMLRHLMCHPSILKCVGIGGILTVLSATSMFGLQGVIDRSSMVTEEQCIFAADQMASVGENSDVNIYWIFLPVVLHTIAQVMLYVPSYEFICAQSPYQMRGLLLGMFFAVQGFFSLLATIVQFTFSAKPDLTYSYYSCSFWYYLIVFVLGALGLCLYVMVAYKYRKRKRDDIFHQVGMIEEYYSSGRIHSSHWI